MEEENIHDQYDPVKVGCRLKEAAYALFGEESGVVKMAKATGILKQKLSHYNTGKGLPNAETLQKLARIGVNVHWLLTGEGDMMSNPEISHTQYVDFDEYDNTEASFEQQIIDETSDNVQTHEQSLREELEKLLDRYRGSVAAGRPQHKKNEE